MSTSVTNKKSSAPATVPAEAPPAEPKKSDVVLTIKVILIALAFFGAIWALERFVSR
jgi:hypothetical protein